MRHSIASMGTKLVLLLAVPALVASCGSTINQQNFDRVETDMTREEVIAILGEPTDSSDVGIAGFSGGIASWSDDDGNKITIQFVNGKVKGKQFFSGDANE